MKIRYAAKLRLLVRECPPDLSGLDPKQATTLGVAGGIHAEIHPTALAARQRRKGGRELVVAAVTRR